MKTLGRKISDYRRMRNMTQEELAEKVNVSSQAVSKWENNLSIPDLPILIELADLFQVTLDDLVRQEESQPIAQIVPKEQRKPIEEMLLRIIVDTNGGDNVRVNLPLSLVKFFVESGIAPPDMNGQDVLKNIDFEQLFLLVQNGAIGKLVEVDSGGNHVEIFVE